MFLMGTPERSDMSIHIWKPDRDGLPRYLCGIKSDEIFASVRHTHVNRFTDDAVCPECLYLHRKDCPQEIPVLMEIFYGFTS